MESNIMINEFISEDYKNAETFTIDNVIIKKSKSFIKDGKEHERIYIDNGGKCMFLVETIQEKSFKLSVKDSLPVYLRNDKFESLVWIGTEEALTVDYELLVDAINKSEGDKKEQLQTLLEKLNNEHIMITAVIDKNIYKYLNEINYLKTHNNRVDKNKQKYTWVD